MASKTASKTSNKKPKWSSITFKKIEDRRKELGLSKSAMAEALGVTNSTYHNWRRGTTIPHVTQQDQIKTTMAGLGSAPKRSASKKRGGNRRASTNGAATRDRRAPGTAGRRSGDVGGGSHPMQPNYTATHPLYPAGDATVPGIATITSAWITSQPKSPSAGSVLKFVENLKGVLHSPGT